MIVYSVCSYVMDFSRLEFDDGIIFRCEKDYCKIIKINGLHKYYERHHILFVILFICLLFCFVLVVCECF